MRLILSAANRARHARPPSDHFLRGKERSKTKPPLTQLDLAIRDEREPAEWRESTPASTRLTARGKHTRTGGVSSTQTTRANSDRRSAANRGANPSLDAEDRKPQKRPGVLQQTPQCGEWRLALESTLACLRDALAASVFPAEWQRRSPFQPPQKKREGRFVLGIPPPAMSVPRHEGSPHRSSALATSRRSLVRGHGQ